MAQFNSYVYSREIESRRCFEKSDDRPFGDNFPFFIERKESDSDDFYKGICEGAKAVYDMWKANIFDESSIPVTYFSNKSHRCMYRNRNIDDNADEDFADDIYEEGFDNGFKQGYQSAYEDGRAEIYVDTDKICGLDQLHQELLDLGRSLHPWDIDKLNSILKRVVDMKYEVAKEAVDEYLGYK